jgi:hypothetical protein
MRGKTRSLRLGVAGALGLTLALSVGGPARSDDGVPPSPAAAPAASSSDQKYSPEELKTLVGPIALYPDVVISSLLPATAFPLDIIAAARMVKEKGGKLDAVPEGVTWDASVQALIQYPDLLLWLNDNTDWLQQMGYAVSVQQGDVLSAIQKFRMDAKKAGNLETNEYQDVSEVPAEGGDGSQDDVIVIQPSDPEVVYIPSYDPYAVTSPGYSGWAFGAGIAVGALGAWAWHSIAWGNHWGGGSININNGITHNGGGNAINGGGSRPWNPPQRPGGGAGNRPGNRPGGGNVARPKQLPANSNRLGGAGGVKAPSSRPGAGRPGGAGGRPSTLPANRPGPAGGGAFGGAGGAGAGAAGNRGRQSLGGGAGGARPAPSTRPSSGGARTGGSRSGSGSFGGVSRGGDRARSSSSRGSRSMGGGGRSYGGRGGSSGGGSRGGGGRGGGGRRR